MGGSLQHGRRLGVTPSTGPSAAIGMPSHPAISMIVMAEPEQPQAQNVSSYGPGQRYARPAQQAVVRPGELVPNYHGAMIDNHAPYMLGAVVREKQTAGIFFGWINQFRRLPLSALPMAMRGVAQKSAFQPFGHLVHRFNANTNWWSAIGAISNNTGFVAQTRPFGSAPVQTPGGQRVSQQYGGLRQAPWTPPPFALQIPRPSTRPKTNPAISIIPPS
jgi:hypothetical protein